MKRISTTLVTLLVFCLLFFTTTHGIAQVDAAASKMRLKNMKIKKIDYLIPTASVAKTEKRQIILFTADDYYKTPAQLKTIIAKPTGKVKDSGTPFGPEIPIDASYEYESFWTGELKNGEGILFLLYTPEENREYAVLEMYRFNSSGKQTGDAVELWRIDAPNGMNVEDLSLGITHRSLYQDFGIALSVIFSNDDYRYKTSAFFIPCTYGGDIDWIREIKLPAKGKKHIAYLEPPVFNGRWFVTMRVNKEVPSGNFSKTLLESIRIAVIKEGDGTSGTKKIIINRKPDEMGFNHNALLPPLTSVQDIEHSKITLPLITMENDILTGGESRVAAPGTAIPRNISVSPTSGSGTSQAFTVSWGDDDGYEDMSSCNFMINTEVSGLNCVWIQFNPNTKILSLRNDTNSDWSRAQAGSAVILENSQVRIDCSAVVFSILNLNDISIQIPMEFSKSFSGRKDLFSRAQDASDNRSSWDDMGDFTVSFPQTATNLYLIYELIHATDDNRDPFYFTYYVQEINTKGKKAGQPYELEMPDWDLDMEKVASRQYIRYTWISDAIPSGNGEVRLAHVKSIIENAYPIINSESNHFMLTLIPETGEIIIDEAGSSKQNGLFVKPRLFDLGKKLGTVYGAEDFRNQTTKLFFSLSRN